MSKDENKSFMLVNPYIASKHIPKIYTHKTPDGSAKKAWEAITKYVTGKLDSFYITMQRVSDDSLYHYEIKETSQEGGGIKFTLSRHEPEENPEMTAHFLKNLDNAKSKGTHIAKQLMKGGKHKKTLDDSSSDSSSDEDYYKNRNTKRVYVEQQQPIYYWWYYPPIYNIDRFFSPTFISPLVPPVEITLTGTFSRTS